MVLEKSTSDLTLNNGVLFYKDAPFSGNLISYYTEDILKSDIQYLRGKKEGYEKEWYTTRDLAQERYYANGIKIGIHKSWWQNGNNKFVYHFNNIGEYHGNVKEWYDTGNLYRDFNYISGREEGSQKLWYQNNKIKANYEVVNGERFGLIGLKKCFTVTKGIDEIKKTVQ